MEFTKGGEVSLAERSKIIKYLKIGNKCRVVSSIFSIFEPKLK